MPCFIILVRMLLRYAPPMLCLVHHYGLNGRPKSVIPRLLPLKRPSEFPRYSGRPVFLPSLRFSCEWTKVSVAELKLRSEELRCLAEATGCMILTCGCKI